MKHNVDKLPKWAQKLIEEKEREIRDLQALKKLHGLLVDKDRDWQTIPAMVESLPLFRLYKNGAHQVCYLNKDDILFVGRAK